MKIVYILFRDFFIISGIFLIFILMFEDIQPGFVFFWFNINYILIPVIISGILTLFACIFIAKNNKK